MGLVPQLWNVLYKQYTERLATGESEASLHEEFSQALGPRIQAINCGGAKPMPTVMQWLKKTFPNANVTENYASTEAGPITNSSIGEVNTHCAQPALPPVRANAHSRLAAKAGKT